MHFIGTWKARIEALMTDYQQQQQRPSAAAAAVRGMFNQQQQQQQRGGTINSSSSSSSRTIVHLDMDCFFAAVAAVGRPEFHGKKIGILSGTFGIFRLHTLFKDRTIAVHGGLIMALSWDLLMGL